MKNLKELTYWIIFIIYEEIIFSILIFGSFPTTAPLIILLSLPLAIGLNLITSLLKRKANVVISYILTFGVSFIVAAQLIYYKIYEAILSFYSIINGGQVAEFMTTIFEVMCQNWIGLILIFIPFILLIILHLTKILKFERNSVKEILVKIIIIFLAYNYTSFP